MWRKKRVRLGRKEFEVIRLLLSNPKIILSKETLLLKIWGSESEAEDNNVEAYISFLRKKACLSAQHGADRHRAQARLPSGGKTPMLNKLRWKVLC